MWLVRGAKGGKGFEHARRGLEGSGCTMRLERGRYVMS